MIRGVRTGWRRPGARTPAVVAAAFVALLAVGMMALSPQSESARAGSASSWPPLVGEAFELEVPAPPAVRRAGGRELREFRAGRRVTAASGCEACHRIGSQGNRGPGPSLTHVGARLSARQIRHALFAPKPPMPSFRGLPHRKLHALVRFLSLLRR